MIRDPIAEFYTHHPYPPPVENLDRAPGTLCIQERLPAGAAGILISHDHSSPGLILPIDATEKRMLDAVDGRRTVAAITGTAGGDELLPQARHFFARLYGYDQVVFDSPCS